MRVRSKARSVFVIVWACAASVAAQESGPGSAPSEASPAIAGHDGPANAREAQKAIDSLQQISIELSSAVSLFETRADQAIAKVDSGYRSGNVQIPGADASLANGHPKIKRPAARKFLAARMIASRSEQYSPALLKDVDHLEELVVEARKRIDAADDVIRGLLVVSVKNLSQREAAESKAKHDQLLKARDAAAQAAKRATMTLPIDLPEADSPQESKEKAWDLVVTGVSVSKPRPDAEPAAHEISEKGAVGLPLSWERNKRITLVREHDYRLAITDAGIQDAKGRHVFYQEEWNQRGVMIVRTRWRVAVDSNSGQHILIKQYPARQRRGDVDDVYASWDRDYVWRVEPQEGSTEPSRSEVESALAEAAQERERANAAVQEYRTAIQRALAQNDQAQAGENHSPPDAALGSELREKLFAIRGHLAQNQVIREAEGKVEGAADRLTAMMRKLESLGAWGNRTTLDGEAPKLPASEWERLQAWSDDEIDLTMRTRSEARAVLPPDLDRPQAKFPALQNDVIVHIVRQPFGQGTTAAALQCLQEVWRFRWQTRGGRRVERIISSIAIDTAGRQWVVSSNTQYYAVGPDDALEGVFDQYASQDLTLGANNR